MNEVVQSCPTLVTPWTVSYQAPPSMGFSRQEYWSGLPLPSPGDLPDPGIKPRSTVFQAGALPSEPPGLILLLILLNVTDVKKVFLGRNVSLGLPPIF